MKATLAIKRACEELESYLTRNKFCPDGVIGERDVQCILYHFCVQLLKSAKNIHAEYNLPNSRRRVDLYLKSRRGGLPVEIKLFNYGMNRKQKWKEKKDMFFSDIHKMGELKAIHKRRPWFILFIKSISKKENIKNEKFLNEIKLECKRSNVTYRQIPQRIDKKIEQLKIYLQS